MTSRLSLPRSIWVLGFVSLLMDVSSELIHSLLPVFMAASLGASATLVGLVEGVAESTALIVKVFSGTLSDYLGKRKVLAVVGYALGAASKPAFALAASVPWVLAARFADRIGKGIRGAPRDALIADLTAPEVRGRAFGLRQALDTVGAFVGPLLALGLMAAYGGDFRKVFWIAVIPGGLAVALLAFGVEEPERAGPAGELRSPIRWEVLGLLPPAYWRVVLLGASLSVARLTEAFLILRARQLGLADSLAPLVLVGMNTVYAAAAYPAGMLADGWNRRKLLAAGMGVLAAAHAVFARADGLGLIALGVALYGAHMALTQGLLSALVADAAPAELRGTAFGVFHFAGGLALLAAGLGGGLLWDYAGPPAMFMAGGGVALLGLLLLR